MQFVHVEKIALYRETKSAEAPPTPKFVMVLILVQVLFTVVHAVILLMISISLLKQCTVFRK